MKWLSVLITILLHLACSSDSPTEPENSAPVISSLTANPSSVTTGNVTTITAIATDPDGDNLTYTWTTTQGTFSSTTGSSVQWTAPSTPGNYSVTCTVNDGTQTTSESLFLTVAQALGKVKGFVYVTGTTTPISGIIVSILSKSDTTSGDGFYELTDIMLGTQTLTAQGDSTFSTFSQSITVNEGDNSRDIFLTAFTLFSGFVRNSLGDPVQGATVKIKGLTQQTNSDGFFQFSPILQAQYTLLILANDYQDFSQNVVLAQSAYQNDVTLNAITYDPPVLRAELSTSNEITLSWTPLSSNLLKGYFISRSVPGEGFQKIISTPLSPSDSSYKDTNLITFSS